MPRRTPLAAVLVALVVPAVALAGCSSGGDAPASSAPTSTAADAAFVRHMLPHHERALEVGRLALERGSDPRVRAFGQRILDEQTPERDALAGWVTTLGLTPEPGDAAMADGYVDDAALARLRTEAQPAFDRDMLLASADSETGAAAMAARELDAGTYGPARALATNIATAPQGEIPQLRDLAAQLPG
ncbi:DUF305 domain-containing protein [Rhodococcus aerolatus]